MVRHGTWRETGGGGFNAILAVIAVIAIGTVAFFVIKATASIGFLIVIGIMVGLAVAGLAWLVHGMHQNEKVVEGILERRRQTLEAEKIKMQLAREERQAVTNNNGGQHLHIHVENDSQLDEIMTRIQPKREVR